MNKRGIVIDLQKILLINTTDKVLNDFLNIIFFDQFIHLLKNIREIGFILNTN